MVFENPSNPSCRVCLYTSPLAELKGEGVSSPSRACEIQEPQRCAGSEKERQKRCGRSLWFFFVILALDFLGYSSLWRIDDRKTIYDACFLTKNRMMLSFTWEYQNWNFIPVLKSDHISSKSFLDSVARLEETINKFCATSIAFVYHWWYSGIQLTFC